MLVPDSDATKALRALSRSREDLVGHRVALANELRAQLECFWPGAAHVFADIDSPIALAFLKRYPSPADAIGLGEQRTARFLARHSYSGRRSPGELLGRLRGAACAVPPSLSATLGARSCWPWSPRLSRSSRASPRSPREIRSALHDHVDGPKFRSLFVDPKTAVCAATMLSEIGDCRERYPTRTTLAADGGQAPVAVKSGKFKRARFRWACDHRLRAAIATLADTSRHHNPWTADIYDRARARGASHQHAIRILGGAWCAIIWRIWQDRDVYDPERHTARQRLTAAAYQSSRISDPRPHRTTATAGAAVTVGCPKGRARSA